MLVSKKLIKMNLGVNYFLKSADVVYEKEIKTVVLNSSSLGNFDAF